MKEADDSKVAPAPPTLYMPFHGLSSLSYKINSNQWSQEWDGGAVTGRNERLLPGTQGGNSLAQLWTKRK